MIKYLGSKKRFLKYIGMMITAVEAQTALDLFAGTTRVSQEFKRRGAYVTAVDMSRYTQIFSQCYIETDSKNISYKEIEESLRYLNSLQGIDGYFTETFCHQSRFFQPHNGQRIDAIREELYKNFNETNIYPILLTSLIEAADRVDSTTGVQMAYIKKWSDRSYKRLELKMPELIEGTGKAIRADATQIVNELPHFDIAYLDPPYNQHSYYGNYHIWETLVAWDKPEHYGIACKRIDVQDQETKSIFNRKREMPKALTETISKIDAKIIGLSYNNESWIDKTELEQMCERFGKVETLSFDSKRYIGAQIGIHNLQGEKSGKISHLRNLEYLVLAGPQKDIEKIVSLIQQVT
jgi:adenine-specific DNA-methyltransferase